MRNEDAKDFFIRNLRDRPLETPNPEDFPLLRVRMTSYLSLTPERYLEAIMIRIQQIEHLRILARCWGRVSKANGLTQRELADYNRYKV